MDDKNSNLCNNVDSSKRLLENNQHNNMDDASGVLNLNPINS